MKIRPLGAATPRPAMPDPAVQPASLPRAQYAAALERDRDGTITRLYLPGQTVASNVPFLAQTLDGSGIRVGWIGSNGRVRSTPDLKANFDPGTKLLATTDASGRVLNVMALRRSGCRL